MYHLVYPEYILYMKEKSRAEHFTNDDDVCRYDRHTRIATIIPTRKETDMIVASIGYWCGPALISPRHSSVRSSWSSSSSSSPIPSFPARLLSSAKTEWWWWWWCDRGGHRRDACLDC